MTPHKRIILLIFAVLMSLGLVTAGMAAASSAFNPEKQETNLPIDDPQSTQEKLSVAGKADPENLDGVSAEAFVGYALFVGVDDPEELTYRINPLTNAFATAFTDHGVWGAAYDYVNQRVLFSSGTSLYAWYLAGDPILLGTITDQAFLPRAMVGLAFYDGALYGVSTTANEAVYIIDTSTLIATVYIDYADANYDFSGLAADPMTGELYATNNADTIYGKGLYRINLDVSPSVITPYPAGQVDLDGLTIDRDGHAYLVPDEPGSIYVYDFTTSAYITPLENPWTQAATFAGAAWIYYSDISFYKTVGLDANTCTNSHETYAVEGSQVTYCYTVTNEGNITLTIHTLEDSQLGMLLDESFELNPGSSYIITRSLVVTETVVNTATWTAYDMGASDVVSATDTATVHVWSNACPVGYEPVEVASVDFEDFPPSGWVITNTTTDCANQIPDEWTNTDPGSYGNLTGGSGKFAIADSDACGNESVMNTTMTSAPINFSGLVSPTITFFTYYNDWLYSSEVANFDVSQDGGSNWDNIFSWNEDMIGPLQVGIPLPDSGEEDVRVRWDYQDATWAYWWEVDDVEVTACGQVAHMQISPEEISSTQVRDQVVTHTLEIDSVGTAALEWTIVEEIPVIQSGYGQMVDGAILSTSDLMDTCYPEDIDWLSISPMTGTLDVDLSQDVDVTFDATGLPLGEYLGGLCITSNAPDSPVVRIPLTLTVELGADLTLTKTASEDSVDPGDILEYTLVVENNGPDPANHTILVDTLPGGIDFISTSAGCSHAGNEVTCNLGTMDIGEISEVHIVVEVTQEYGILTNLALVTADELDINFNDNFVRVDTLILLYTYLPFIAR